MPLTKEEISDLLDLALAAGDKLHEILDNIHSILEKKKNELQHLVRL